MKKCKAHHLIQLNYYHFCVEIKAGKTSLLRRLISSHRNYQAPQVTDGINIEDWVIDLENKTQLTYSTWDFGWFLTFAFCSSFCLI